MTPASGTLAALFSFGHQFEVFYQGMRRVETRGATGHDARRGRTGAEDRPLGGRDLCQRSPFVLGIVGTYPYVMLETRFHVKKLRTAVAEQ